MMEYVHKRSLVHDLHPVTKLAWAILIMILALLFNDPLILAGLIVSVVVVGALGKALRGTLTYLSAMFAVAAFVFIFQIFFQPGGAQLYAPFPASWPVLGGIVVTERGVLYGLAMSLRVLCLISPFPVIFATTQPREIVMSLVETLRVPYDYAFMFTTALRFMPIVMSEVSTISQAQRARAYAVEGWNPLRKLKAIIPIALPIVFIAIEKSDRLGLSMDLRGYGSKNRTSLHKLTFRPLDLAVLGLLILALALTICARVLGYGVVVMPERG